MRQSHYYRGLYPYSLCRADHGTAVKASAKVPRRRNAVNPRAGGTKKPWNWPKWGVDMTKPNPIREAVAYVGSLVDEVVESFQRRIPGTSVESESGTLCGREPLPQVEASSHPEPVFSNPRLFRHAASCRTRFRHEENGFGSTTHCRKG